MKTPWPLPASPSPELLAEFNHRAAVARRFAADDMSRYASAYDWRQRFAESRGFPDFTAVMEYGIVRAHKLPCRTEHDPLDERMT